MAEKTERYIMSGTQLCETATKHPKISLLPSFDLCFNGGCPTGVTMVLAGAPGTGKTTLALYIAAEGQKQLDKKVFFFPIEGRLMAESLEQIKHLKKDIEHFKIIGPPPITDDEDKVIGVEKWSIERWYEEIARVVQEEPGCIIIVDSIAAGATEHEISGGFNVLERGAKQKVEAKFTRLIASQIQASGTLLILITQIQSNQNAMHGPATSAKMGNAIAHCSDITMVVKYCENWTGDSNISKRTGGSLGHKIFWNISKNNLGPKNFQVGIDLRYGEGPDLYKDVMDQSVNFGVIEGKGAWYYLPFIEQNDGSFVYSPVTPETKDAKGKKVDRPFIKLNGLNQVRNWMYLHEKEFLKLKDELYKVMGIEINNETK